MIPTDTDISENLKVSLDRYANSHIRVGGFLTAVLSNDLMAAFAKADPDSIPALHGIVGYCFNEIPGDCWGSPEKVRAWLTPPEPTYPNGDPETYYNERAEQMP